MRKTEWQCVQCGLEVIILQPEGLCLPFAECEDCGMMTLREKKEGFLKT